jgi:hypothetical protein
VAKVLIILREFERLSQNRRQLFFSIVIEEVEKDRLS